MATFCAQFLLFPPLATIFLRPHHITRLIIVLIPLSESVLRAAGSSQMHQVLLLTCLIYQTGKYSSLFKVPHNIMSLRRAANHSLRGSLLLKISHKMAQFILLAVQGSLEYPRVPGMV